MNDKIIDRIDRLTINELRREVKVVRARRDRRTRERDEARYERNAAIRERDVFFRMYMEVYRENKNLRIQNLDLKAQIQRPGAGHSIRPATTPKSEVSEMIEHLTELAQELETVDGYQENLRLAVDWLKRWVAER